MFAARDALPSALSELPNELLLAIVSQLQVERGFLADEEAEVQRQQKNIVVVRSLYAIVLSCHKLNAIGTPLLYQSIIQTLAQPYLPSLLRTLISKPELARVVQYIEFATILYSKDVPEVYTASDLERFEECLSNAKWVTTIPTPSRHSETYPGDASDVHTKERMLFQALKNVRQEATPFYAFVILFSLVDNFTDVALPYFYPDRPDVLSILAFKQYSQPGTFRRLWLGNPVPLSPNYALRTFVGQPRRSGGCLTDYIRGALLNPCQEYEPLVAMEEIMLNIFDAKPSLLGHHFKNCCSIERISCLWGQTDRFTPNHIVDLPSLRIALEPFQNSLIELTIDTMESGWLVDMDTSIPAIGDLSHFIALKHLDVTALVLWGDDDTLDLALLSSILPTSLETLAIKAEWDDDVEEVLNYLSLDCATTLPNLRTIECSWRPAPRPTAEYLTDAFKRLGVDLVLDICNGEEV